MLAEALGVQPFREDREQDTEFVTISYWDTVGAMTAFAGGDPTSVHHLERDPEFLLELPQKVQVLRLVGSHGVVGAGR